MTPEPVIEQQEETVNRGELEETLLVTTTVFSNGTDDQDGIDLIGIFLADAGADGIEVFIHPDYRGLRLARRMYEYRKELCEKLNLKAIMFGGRIPNYHKYADTMRPKEYLDKVRSREIYDPVLTFQLSNDFHVRRVMKNYLPNDEESKHCATLLQWDNIYYQPPTQDYVDKKTTVRVGLVQWQMRIASGAELDFGQNDVMINGHAIECRINAENPEKGFRPSPGTITDLHLPGGKGIRVDSAIYSGCSISPYYDSMVAKLIVWAKNRDEAIQKMQSALGEVIIEGIDTNVDYLYELLNNPVYQSGEFNVNFIDTIKH